MKFDKETEKWFISNPYTETSVMQCDECGLWYKPSLGHKCKKMAEAQEKGKGKKMESQIERNLLLPCPFCGGKAKFSKRTEDNYYDNSKITTTSERYRVYCTKCSCGTEWCFYHEDAVNNWNSRYGGSSIYDQEETIEGCTVQILRNSVTGEESVGWWRGKKEDMPNADRSD